MKDSSTVSAVDLPNLFTTRHPAKLELVRDTVPDMMLFSLSTTIFGGLLLLGWNVVHHYHQVEAFTAKNMGSIAIHRTRRITISATAAPNFCSQRFSSSVRQGAGRHPRSERNEDSRDYNPNSNDDDDDDEHNGDDVSFAEQSTHKKLRELKETATNQSLLLEENQKWRALCEAMEVLPRDLLRLETSTTGLRGVHVQRAMRVDDVLLSIPLHKCLREDELSSLFCTSKQDIEADDADDFDDQVTVNNRRWVKRLAALLIDKQLAHEKGELEEMHLKIWFDLLPNKEILRASLPIHWNDKLIQSTRCTALEIAVDTAFFDRAAIIQDLLKCWKVSPSIDNAIDQKRCIENTLDVIQTRTCRVGRSVNPTTEPLRIVAPVFDFINHSIMPNARFQLEEGGNYLTVRALADIPSGGEVLIDYGASTRPAWKCLSSYGFVPDFPLTTNERSKGEYTDNEALAEVYMDGVRYEVGPSFIPEDMVAAALDSFLIMGESGVTDADYIAQEETVELTADVALRLSNRLALFGFQLLVDPPSNHEEMEELDDTENAESIVSEQLAASLRWNQHRILLQCSKGLQEYAHERFASGNESV